MKFSISGKGIPNELPRSSRTVKLPEGIIPKSETAFSEYATSGGHLTINSVFGNDPEKTSASLGWVLKMAPEALKGFSQVATHLAIRVNNYALALLHLCSGFCKLIHITSVMPPHLILSAMQCYDVDIRRSFANVTGVDTSDTAWKQAKMNLCRGGLGLCSLADHSSAAYIASFCTGRSVQATPHLANVISLYKVVLQIVIPYQSIPTDSKLCARKEKYPEIDAAVFDWFYSLRTPRSTCKPYPISRSLIQVRAFYEAKQWDIVGGLDIDDGDIMIFKFPPNVTMKMALLLGSFQKSTRSSRQAGGTHDKADSSRGTPSSMDAPRAKVQSNMANIKKLMLDIAHASHHLEYLQRAEATGNLPRGLSVKPRMMMLVSADETTTKLWKEQTKINTLGYMRVAMTHYENIVRDRTENIGEKKLLKP
ncbi:hypothetical protein EMCRGX_G007819 [Ephydatia muelleri]